MFVKFWGMILVDFINGYNSNLYSRNYFNNSAQIDYNPNIALYGQNPNVQNNPCFNAPLSDTVTFGTAEAPAGVPSAEKKNANKTLLFLGGVTAVALGAIFHKNLSRFLGLEKNVIKNTNNIDKAIEKESENIVASVQKTKINTAAVDQPISKKEETIVKVIEENKKIETATTQATKSAKITEEPLPQQVPKQIEEMKNTPRPTINTNEEQIRKQIEFEKTLDFSRNFARTNEHELDKILLNSNGEISKSSFTNETCKLDELIKPYDGEINMLYHGTTAENKKKILMNGFSDRIAPKNGYLDGAGGIYFTTTETNKYGTSLIKAKFNGKVATVDTNLLNDIKIGNICSVGELLNKKGLNGDNAEHVIREYLKNKVVKMGYTGIIGKNYSYAADCKYFAVLEPKSIKIVQ